jgi:cyclohexadieny/prephenate dehydrogenase
MAGSEKTGWTAAKAELFQDRTCFLTPLPEAAPESLDLLARFWSALGARVTTTTPDRHDEIVAAVSHLPHLLAAALGVTLSEGPADWRPFAGNGLRDSTRIAAGDPDLWLAILQANREEVLRALRRHQDTLQSLHALLANGDWPTLHANLKRAKLWRDGLV